MASLEKIQYYFDSQNYSGLVENIREEIANKSDSQLQVFDLGIDFDEKIRKEEERKYKAKKKTLQGFDNFESLRKRLDLKYANNQLESLQQDIIVQVDKRYTSLKGKLTKSSSPEKARQILRKKKSAVNLIKAKDPKRYKRINIAIKGWETRREKAAAQFINSL